MSADYVESEVKFYAGSAREVEGGLIAAGAVLISPRTYERNVRYEDAGRTMSGRGIVLRLRQDSRARLTYKEPPGAVPPEASGVSYRFEVEVEVSNYDAMALILEKLGYHPDLIYEKYRTTYELLSCEVVIDEMPYGTFVEIEGSPEAIDRAAAAIGFGSARRYLTNYIRLFDLARSRLGLTFHDLTFANFAGIDVPESVFLEGDDPPGDLKA
jgi:adenylate cyclase class 2